MSEQFEGRIHVADISEGDERDDGFTRLHIYPLDMTDEQILATIPDPDGISCGHDHDCCGDIIGWRLRRGLIQ